MGARGTAAVRLDGAGRTVRTGAGIRRVDRPVRAPALPKGRKATVRRAAGRAFLRDRKATVHRAAHRDMGRRSKIRTARRALSPASRILPAAAHPATGPGPDMVQARLRAHPATARPAVLRARKASGNKAASKEGPAGTVSRAPRRRRRRAAERWR